MTGSAFLGGKIDGTKLRSVIQSNRKQLADFETWIPAGLLENSVFGYGIPPSHEKLLNLPVDQEPTHADLLCYFAQNLEHAPRYLELGVSVGKTFWQVMLSRPDIECWGFDIEEINPVLLRHLRMESREEWPSLENSRRKAPSSISRFTKRETGQRVVYICADIFDARAWRLLEDGMFNLVLSDALHSSEALDFEWTQMVAGRLFNPNETVIMWDDLDGEMRKWFERQRPAIATELFIDRSDIGTVFINGWLGKREFPHRLGLALKLQTSHRGP